MAINKIIYKYCEDKFKELLRKSETEDFKAIQYKEEKKDGYSTHSYDMMEYTTMWAKYLSLINRLLREKTGDIKGIFTRKRTFNLSVFDNITEEDIIKEPKTMRSFFD